MKRDLVRNARLRHWAAPAARAIGLASFLALSMWLSACETSPTGTHQTTGAILQAKNIIAWRNPAVRSSGRTAQDGSSVYFFDWFTDSVFAVAKSDGHLLWKTALPTHVEYYFGYGMVVVGNRVVVGNDDVYALDATTGALMWKFSPSVGVGAGWAAITSEGTTIYCGSRSGYAYAIDALTGSEKWATRIITGVVSQVQDPVIADGVVYYGLSQAASVFDQRSGGAAAVSASTGELLWKMEFPRPSPTVATEMTGGVALTRQFVIAPAPNGPVYALSRSTGAIVKTLPPELFEFPGNTVRAQDPKTVATEGSTVFVGTSAEALIALDAEDLHRIWIVGGFGSVVEIAASDSLVFAMGLGSMSVRRRDNGALAWSLRRCDLRTECDEGFNSHPIWDNNFIYSGSVTEAFAFKAK